MANKILKRIDFKFSFRSKMYKIKLQSRRYVREREHDQK
jgi:hypothetical protein